MLKTENYCITKENFIVHELVGLEAEIVESNDRNKKGIKGKVVDETRNLFIIESRGIEKKVPKKEAKIRLTIGDEKVEVDGKAIIARPEDRTKLFWRKLNGRLQ